MRISVILAAAASLALATGTAFAAPAGKLNTDAFLAACAKDANVTEMPGLEAGAKVTAQAYCECVAGKVQASKLSQADVDMLTKVHKDEVTDEDAKNYPTLEDLLTTSEGFEDSCKQSLGMPADEEDEAPSDEAPADEDAAPPE